MTIGGSTIVDGEREDESIGDSMEAGSPIFGMDAFRLLRKQNQKRNEAMRTTTKPPPKAPPTMEPIGDG